MGGLSGWFGATRGHAGTPHFPGPRFHLQKMALQKSPWGCRIRRWAVRRGLQRAPWMRQRVDVDGHDF